MAGGQAYAAAGAAGAAAAGGDNPLFKGEGIMDSQVGVLEREQGAASGRPA